MTGSPSKPANSDNRESHFYRLPYRPSAFPKKPPPPREAAYRPKPPTAYPTDRAPSPRSRPPEKPPTVR